MWKVNADMPITRRVRMHYVFDESGTRKGVFSKFGDVIQFLIDQDIRTVEVNTVKGRYVMGVEPITATLQDAATAPWS